MKKEFNHLKKCSVILLAFSVYSSVLSLPPSSVYADTPDRTKTEQAENTEPEAAPSLKEKQETIEKALRAEFDATKPTLENPMVKLDPYGISPLSALVLFSTDKNASISFVVEGKDKSSTIAHTYTNLNINHEIPIYGLYANKDNKVTITATYEDGTTKQKALTIRTSAVPNNFPTFNIKTALKEEMAEGLNFYTAAISLYTCAFDFNGDPRWYLSDIGIGGANPIKKLSNGNIMVGSEIFLPDGYYRDRLYEMDFSGKIYEEYKINGVHHDFVEMPDQNLLVLSNNPDGQTVEDYIWKVDRQTGELLQGWDIHDLFPVEKKSDLNYGGNSKDWFHVNAIYYDPEDHTAILSGRCQDAVFQCNLDTGEIIWVLSDPNDEWPDVLKSKLLTPVGDNFEWSYGQHAVTKLPDGSIMLFDNGNFRSKTADIVPADQNYSRAVIYKIDEENLTVEQLWQYGKERGSELFSSFVGDVDYYGENHYLIHFGGIIIDGHSATYDSGAILTPKGNSKSVTIEIKDDEVIFEGVLGKGGGVAGNAYRCDRMTFYSSDQERYDIIPAK